MEDSKKISKWLFIPFGFIIIVILLILGETNPSLIVENNWILIVLMGLMVIFEILKAGYSIIQVMYMKIFWTIISFFVLGGATTLWLTKCAVPLGSNYYTFDHAPWQVYLTLMLIGAIDLIGIVFVVLKAGMKEWNLNSSDH